MGQNRSSIDPSLFTTAQGTVELEANALRESLAYDAYGSQTEFSVIVLTTPIPMAGRDAAAVFSGASNIQATNPLEGGIVFKGRIIGNGFISPHASIPNPCNLDRASSPGVAIKIINMHTTFQSVTSYSGRIPNIGDVVTVKLQAGDIKFNLQNAVFDKITNAADSSKVANSMAAQCQSLADTFEAFDPENDLGDMDFAYADNSNEGPRVPEISRAQAQPTIDSIVSKLTQDPGLLGYTPLSAGKCGIPSDFFGSSPSAAETALIEKYTPVNCEERVIGKSVQNSPVKVKGHPVWLNTLEAIYAAAQEQSWWIPHITKYGVEPICFSAGYRSIDTQIFLRMKNGGHRTFDEVMSSPPSPRCSPPTAPPGKSRHNLGLAMDFCGSIGAKGGGAQTEAHKWLEKQGLEGNSTYDIKNYQKENWHWSVDGS